ncbi:MAG: cytochrome c maturation protein CcmE [Pseudomonadales bacterium]|nr:cytochrome c maturation protein CcmE [Pseudomonadales bacterium]
MKPQRRKRLILIFIIVAAAGLAVGLATYALRQNINLFYTPSQLAQGDAPQGARLRAGGMVVKGSLQRDPHSLTVHFMITDFKHQVAVTYTGILPDLFREGQGIIATGHFEHGIMQADEVLAKHDEKYQPPELKGMVPPSK